MKNQTLQAVKNQKIQKKGWKSLKVRPLTGACALSQLLGLALCVQPLVAPGAAFAKESMGNATPPAVNDEMIGGKSFSVSKIVIHAHPDQVFHVLTDYGNASRVFPQMRTCKVVSEHGTTKVMHHEIVPSGIAHTAYGYNVEVKEIAGKSLEWHRVSGDFKAVDGFWKLEPLEGGRFTEVTYSTYVNGGFFIPQILIKHQFKVDMPVILTHLKNEAEMNSTRLAHKPDEFIHQ